VQQGDLGRRLRRSSSFIVSAGAVVVALALMAVADGGGANPGLQSAIGGIARAGSGHDRGVAAETPVARPTPAPAANRANVTPPVAPAPPAPPVAVGPVQPALASVVLPMPAPAPISVPPASSPKPTSPPKTVPPPIVSPPPTIPPKTVSPPPATPPTTRPPTTRPPTTGPPTAGPGRSGPGRSGNPDGQDEDVSCGRSSEGSRPERGRTGDRPSRSDDRHRHRDTPTSCRPHWY
jgi:hypothetical protein